MKFEERHIVVISHCCEFNNVQFVREDMRKKTQSELRIERLCRMSRFSPCIVRWKSKKILDAYREAQDLKKYSMKDEQIIIRRMKTKIQEKYNKSYIQRINQKTSSLDYMLLDILGTEWAEGIIDKVFEKMRDFDEEADDYAYILTEYYLSEEKREDIDIQIDMEVTHSKYYRLKNRAILLFGIMLWLTILEECVYNTNAGEAVAFG